MHDATKPNLIAGRAVQIIAEMAEITVPAAPPPNYWESDFLEQVLERVTDPEFKESAEFDYLVIDEAQDILARPKLWECIVGFLKGGLGGAFCLFGDFENQVLNGREPMEAKRRALEGLPGNASAAKSEESSEDTTPAITTH